MGPDKGVRARRVWWSAACCAGAALLATAQASANPKPLLPSTHGHLWSSGDFGGAFLDLVADFIVLAIVGWLLGPFRRGFHGRFLLWGGAIWVGGLVADTIGYNSGGSRTGQIVTAMILIFGWNLLLAAVLAKGVWWRPPALAATIAVVTAPYFMPDYTTWEGPRVVLCISNLKQIVIAARMYADDWEGVLPDVGSYDGDFCGNWTPGPFWGDAIRQYVKASDDIFKCPSVHDLPAPSYGWNRHLSRCPEKLVEYPTLCPLAWDWVPGLETAPGIPLDPPDDPGKRGSETRWGYYPAVAGAGKADLARACSRHAGGLILGFVDGHVKFERPTSERFAKAADGPMPWPTDEQRGLVITMYPRDPNAHGDAGGG
jgi:prepilin-type processing-associated H-X9-DG protein